MDGYKKIYKELQTRYTDEEIAEGFMIPAQSLAEVSEADSAEFLKQRLKLLEERTEEDRAIAEAIRLRIQVQSYLEEEPFSEEYSFDSVLAAYLALSGREEAVFAAQLDIAPLLLRQLLSGDASPSIDLLYRLETHAGGIITALHWWKLLAREQEHLILHDEAARTEAQAHVQNTLRAS